MLTTSHSTAADDAGSVNPPVTSHLLETILADESYRPAEPGSVADTGLPASLLESLILKRLAAVGIASGRQLAEDVGLPFPVLEGVYRQLRARQQLVHKSSAPLNDYCYDALDGGWAGSGDDCQPRQQLLGKSSGSAHGLCAVDRGAIDPRNFLSVRS